MENKASTHHLYSTLDSGFSKWSMAKKKKKMKTEKNIEKEEVKFSFFTKDMNL